jgi:hypothetical protein
MKPGERIPLHDHIDNNAGGRLHSSSFGTPGSTTTIVVSTPGSVSAADVAIADTGGNFTGTDVEAALAELAGGGTPTLAEVLAQGNDTGGTTIGTLSNLLLNIGTPPINQYALLRGGQGGVGEAGGKATLAGGSGDDDNTVPAEINARGGGVTTAGRISILTDATYGNDGQVLTAQGDGSAIWADAPGAGSGDASGQFVAGWDGGGAELDTGTQVDIVAPFSGTITGWTLLADQEGDAVVDIWLDTLGNYPPSDIDSITAAAPPTLSGATNAADAEDGWDTTVTAGDILRFNLDSVADVTRLLCVIDYTRP